MWNSLRRTLAGWLRGAAGWVDVPAPPVDLAPLQAAALACVREQDARWPDRDGEAKRHQVYAQLIKAFPAQGRRVLARAIEDAVDSGHDERES